MKERGSHRTGSGRVAGGGERNEERLFNGMESVQEPKEGKKGPVVTGGKGRKRRTWWFREGNWFTKKKEKT